MRVIASLALLLVGCAPSPQAPSSNDLVVAAVAPTVSAQPIASSPVTRHNVLPPAPPTLTAPIAMRMRDALLASAPAQAVGALDLQLYQDAVERERAGDLAGARKAYYDLVTQVPTSPLVPYAYLAFGDLFMAEAERGAADHYPLAIAAYEKVLAAPPPGNRAYAYAAERLAACYLHAGDHPHALASSKRALDATRVYPSQSLANEVADLARATLVEAFAIVGQPDRAPTFFLAADPSMASALIVSLGGRYAAKGASRDLLLLYANALASANDETLCAGARAAVQSLARLQGHAYAAALEAKRSAVCGP